jgi:cytochrome b5
MLEVSSRMRPLVFCACSRDTFAELTIDSCLPSLILRASHQVARHTSSTDCWMVVDGKVYDVTRFLDEHPGGEDIMLDSSGRDATREFEDVGHSGEARSQLEDLLIGTLREPTEEEKAAAAAEEALNPVTAKAAGSSIAATTAKWLFPLAIIGVAFLIRKYLN